MEFIRCILRIRDTTTDVKHSIRSSNGSSFGVMTFFGKTSSEVRGLHMAVCVSEPI